MSVSLYSLQKYSKEHLMKIFEHLMKMRVVVGLRFDYLLWVWAQLADLGLVLVDGELGTLVGLSFKFNLVLRYRVDHVELGLGRVLPQSNVSIGFGLFALELILLDPSSGRASLAGSFSIGLGWIFSFLFIYLFYNSISMGEWCKF